jgi:TPP-dependent pyruvate/acetoin dehydrogenase alpha subunit
LHPAETRRPASTSPSAHRSPSPRSRSARAYAYPGELSPREWKPILRLAAAHTAPILIVVLPGSSPTPGQLGLTSTASGVPGIPVDATDPVALYRVAQESILRVRSGGGPALMECIPFRIPGRPAEPADPILTMRQFMLSRGIVTDPWFEKIARRFARRLSSSIQ